MMRVLLAFFGLLALEGCTTVRAAAPERSAPPAVVRPDSSGPKSLTLVAGGMERRCDVYEVEGTEKRPLVILIHCSTDTAETAVRKTGFADLAERHGFMLAVPEVAAPGKGWTSHPSIFGKHPPADDIGFFRYLISKLKAEYPVDPSRIYLVGQLSGGMMAYRLAAEMSGQIAAIGVVNASIGVTATSSNITSRIPRPANPVPVVAFHGWANDVLPYDGGEGTRGARSYFSVNDSMDFWREVNGCSGEPQVQRFGKRSTVAIRYPADDGFSDVVLYKLPRADHEWPEAILIGVRRVTPAEIMWQFFAEKRR